MSNKNPLAEFFAWIETLAEDMDFMAWYGDTRDFVEKSDFLALAVRAAEVVGCADCAICAVDCCEIDEYYMVTNELWGKYGVRYGMLCVGCLEDRMGRELVAADFMPGAGDNELGRPWSERLTNRR